MQRYGMESCVAPDMTNPMPKVAHFFINSGGSIILCTRTKYYVVRYCFDRLFSNRAGVVLLWREK